MDGLDELIGRLQVRAADPERRVDCRTSAFAAGVGALDPAALVAQLGRAQADLARLLEAGPEGPPPDLVARADELAAQMAAPAEPDLPPPAPPMAVAAAEAALGLALPSVLRRALVEVADGGFGPAYGLMPVATMAAETLAWRDDAAGRAAAGAANDWPAGWVVLADLGCGAIAGVDAADPLAPVWELDPTELEDEDDPLATVTTVVAPSLEGWLDGWVRSPSPAEQEAASLAGLAAEIWAEEPRDELDHLRREWLREQGLAPPG